MKWYVWNRLIHSDGSSSAWCDVPKTYRSKRAAHRAVADLTANSIAGFAAITPRSALHFQYVALPDGMKPRHDMVFIEKELS